MSRLAPCDEQREHAPPAQAGLQESLPCQALRVRDRDGTARPCGRPSAVRVRAECECGNLGYRFICARCYGELCAGTLRCYHCERPVRRYRES